MHYEKEISCWGLVIAVVGCDGAGKSTVVKELQHWLVWKMDVRKYYLGSEDGLLYFLKLLTKAVRSHLHGNREMKTLPQNDNHEPSYVLYLGKAFLAWCRYRKVLKIKKDCYNGSIVLTDRYPQIRYRGIYDGPYLANEKQNSAILNVLAQYEEDKYKKISLLVPDIVIKLYVPAEIALQRKPDHNRQIIQRKVEIIDQLSYEGAAVINVDALVPLEKVVGEIKNKVWEAF